MGRREGVEEGRVLPVRENKSRMMATALMA